MMQERRTSIRMAHAVAAQYCPSDDLLPRDGKLQDVSERGAKFLAREPRKLGDRITVTFPLEEDQESLTVTGEVRWSAPAGRWSATGLEWLTLDPAARYRLHSFLHGRAQALQTQRTVWGNKPSTQTTRSATRIAAIAGGTVIVTALAFAAWSLHQTNTQLDAALQQRDAVIGHLESRVGQLATALGDAHEDLERATAEVARLDLQAQSLQSGAAALTSEIQRFQLAYAKSQRERTELIDQIVSLEQERMELTRRLSSLPELRQAVREAIQARMAEDRLRTRVRWSADESMEWGNRGYVLTTTPSAPSPGLSITVLDPAAAPAPASETPPAADAAP